MLSRQKTAKCNRTDYFFLPDTEQILFIILEIGYPTKINYSLEFQFNYFGN